ncbi:hypothetical protein GQ53DRAFT_264238 [Thozetella sp. PMI_491]|nr:hypothetical protein GQ53DRAFT_264238 [Thozetella sp. PMI_491]
MIPHLGGLPDWNDWWTHSHPIRRLVTRNTRQGAGQISPISAWTCVSTSRAESRPYDPKAEIRHTIEGDPIARGLRAWTRRSTGASRKRDPMLGAHITELSLVDRRLRRRRMAAACKRATSLANIVTIASLEGIEPAICGIALKPTPNAGGIRISQMVRLGDHDKAQTHRRTIAASVAPATGTSFCDQIEGSIRFLYVNDTPDVSRVKARSS